MAGEFLRNWVLDRGRSVTWVCVWAIVVRDAMDLAYFGDLWWVDDVLRAQAGEATAIVAVVESGGGRGVGGDVAGDCGSTRD